MSMRIEWSRDERWSDEDGALWRSDHVDYGVRDAKGRACGGYSTIEYHAASEHVEGRRFWARDIFIVNTTATRDGKAFGAYSHGSNVSTFEAAMALGAKKLEAARRRYVRAAQTGTGRQFAKGG